MAIPTTRQSFCGCSLRTGVLILAYLGLIVAVFFIVQLAFKEDMPDNCKSTFKLQTDIKRWSILITNGILYVILLQGVYKESRNAILFVVHIKLAAILVLAIYLFITCLIIDQVVAGTEFMIWLLLEFIFIILDFTWVKYSYAEELKNETTNLRLLA